MARIIDLDLIAPPGVTVRKDGIEYQLPGDPPIHVWLAVIDAYDQWAAADGNEANEALGCFHDRMLDLFQIENPDLEMLPFGPAGMFEVLSGFYGGVDEDEPDPPRAEKAPSTTRTRNGRASSAAKPRTTTRSRSSR